MSVQRPAGELNQHPGRILVTGGAGYIGSRLCPELLARGWEVRILDLQLYGDVGVRALAADPRWEQWRGRFESVRGDTRDPDVVWAALQGVDAVINLAGIAHDPAGGLDDLLTRQCNYDAVGVLVALARRAGVSRVIQASTSSVYGVKQEPAVVERLEPEPIGSYARYKALSEWLLVAAAAPDFCTVNLRAATVCGWSPRQRFDLTVNKLTADALSKGVICVHGGQQRRPNVHMDDLVRCYLTLLEAPAAKVSGRTFNLSIANMKVIEIAELIQRELADLDVRIDVVDVRDVRDYRLDAGLLAREVGFVPTTPISAAVRTLRKHVLELGSWADVDADEHYNLRAMKLDRRDTAYRFLGGEGP